MRACPLFGDMSYQGNIEASFAECEDKVAHYKEVANNYSARLKWLMGVPGGSDVYQDADVGYAATERKLIAAEDALNAAMNECAELKKAYLNAQAEAVIVTPVLNPDSVESSRIISEAMASETAATTADLPTKAGAPVSSASGAAALPISPATKAALGIGILIAAYIGYETFS